MLDIFGLQKFYQYLLYKNLHYFIFALLLLACAPLGASLLFDFIIVRNEEFDPLVTLLIVLFLLVLLLSFISIAIKASCRSSFTGAKRLIIIMASYLMIWLAFGNLYYFFSNTENYLQMHSQLPSASAQKAPDTFGLKWQRRTVINNIPALWQLQNKDDGYTLKPINRIDGYVDCLYFSGVTLMTIGYGDIVPAAAFIKMLALLEAFLGQFIIVIAIGLWLASVKL